MKGSIRKRVGKDGKAVSYLLKYELPRGADGKRRTKYETHHGTKATAETRLRELLATVEGGTYVPATKRSVEDWLEHWLANHAVLNAAPKAHERYVELLRTHVIPQIGEIQLQRLRTPQVQEIVGVMREKGRSPTTIRYCISLLKLALGTAVAQGELAANPCVNVSIPKLKKEVVRALKQDQLTALLQALKDTRFHTLAVLAAGTGMRRGEMLALRWSDIDFDARRISVRRSLEQTAALGVVERAPKSASSNRDIPISESLVRFLRDHWRQSAEEALAIGVRLTADARVFHTLPDVEKPWVPDTLSGKFSEAAKRRGFDVTLHALRHTHATLLLEAKHSIKGVSQRLGHADVRVTLSVYAHVFRETAEQLGDAAGELIAGAI